MVGRRGEHKEKGIWRYGWQAEGMVYQEETFSFTFIAFFIPSSPCHALHLECSHPRCPRQLHNFIFPPLLLSIYKSTNKWWMSKKRKTPVTWKLFFFGLYFVEPSSTMPSSTKPAPPTASSVISTHIIINTVTTSKNSRSNSFPATSEKIL